MRELWWYYRRDFDPAKHEAACHHIVDVIVDAAGNQAAADAIDLDPRERAQRVAEAEARINEYYRPKAVTAVERFVAATTADINRQRVEHIAAHGCSQTCPRIRGRRW